MTTVDDYTFYLTFIVVIGFSIFLFVGAIIAIKSKKNSTSYLLVLSSAIGMLAIFSTCFFVIKRILMYELGLSSMEKMKQFDTYVTYQEISFYVAISASCFFAFTFVAFCNSVASIRKRNEQLEFMVDELTNKNS